MFLYGKFITLHNSQLQYDYRRNVWNQHPYLHQKGLNYVWLQLFCQRIPCLYEYMKVGERKLKCRQELSKEVDKNAVTIIRSDLCEKEAIPGHSPQKIPKICSMFLKVPNTWIKVQVVVKRLNHGGSYGIGKYSFFFLIGIHSMQD